VYEVKEIENKVRRLKEIETKWQKEWEKNKIFEANPDKNKEKFFITFPFPYINGLPHLGSAFTILRVDIMARYKRMKGYNVLFPQGWHATGGPIVSSAKRIKDGDKRKIEELKDMGINENDIRKFEDPSYWVFYFMKEWESDFRRYGLSIDWRRKFFTTNLNKYYSKFIEWQYHKLKELNLIGKGSHPVVWCPKERKVVGDHDRPDEYAGITPAEATIIKFKTKEGYIMPALTYRPETIFGVTNLWIHPNYDYYIVEVDGENWIANDYIAEELGDQKHRVKIKGKISPRELIGKKAINPINGEEVLILPASFVKPDEGTGVVMSVPAHAPYDFIALEQLKKNTTILKDFDIKIDEVSKLSPIIVMISDKVRGIPAASIVKKLGIKSQEDIEKLEKATKELYSIEYYNGIMVDGLGKYSKKKASEAREAIKKHLIESNSALKLYTLPSKVYCRCGARTHVKYVENQWFLLYSNKEWKEKAKEAVKLMNFFPQSLRSEFLKLIDWINDWAFTHMKELGTPLPWDKNWVIESLSDSTIYMAYYTISHYLQGLNENMLKPELFDYIFLGNGDIDKVSSITGLDKKTIEKMRQEFLYWYPLDLRISGKDLMQNHLVFFILHHVAIFGKDLWPRGIGINGWVLLNGKKMAKSTGNFITLRQALNYWGADATRWAEVIAGADPGYEDANFESNIAEKAVEELNLFLNTIKRSYNKGREEEREIDKWFESVLNSTIREVTAYMEETKFKSALIKAYYELQNKYRWYIRRSKEPNKSIAKKYFEAVTLMIAPIVPHVAEEAWHLMGHKDLISASKWPVAEEEKINEDYEKAEEIIKGVLEDSMELMNLIKDVRRLHIIVASKWKYELFDDIKSMLVDNTLKEAIKLITKQKSYSIPKKDISKVIEFVMKNPDIIKKYINRDLELKVLLESKEFLSKELGIEVIIEKEEDSSIAKKKLSIPSRPSLYLE